MATGTWSAGLRTASFVSGTQRDGSAWSRSELTSESCLPSIVSRCQSSWGLTVGFLLEDTWPSFPFTHLASWPCLWVQIRHWGELWRSRSTFTKLWSLVFKCKSPPPGVAVLQEYWSGWPFPSPEDLPNPSRLHCRQLLYHLSRREVGVGTVSILSATVRHQGKAERLWTFS